MKTLLHSDTDALENALREFHGNTFATITTVTEVPCRKNPFGKIYKIAKVNVGVGSNYTNSVNRQMEREGIAGEFKAAKPVWGEKVEGTSLVKHNGKTYLQTHILNPLGYKYFCRENSGKIVILPKYIVHEFMSKKPEGTRQPTEKKTMVRKYTLTNIRKITSGGISYKIG